MKRICSILVCFIALAVQFESSRAEPLHPLVSFKKGFLAGLVKGWAVNAMSGHGRNGPHRTEATGNVTFTGTITRSGEPGSNFWNGGQINLSGNANLSGRRYRLPNTDRNGSRRRTVSGNVTFEGKVYPALEVATTAVLPPIIIATPAYMATAISETSNRGDQATVSASAPLPTGLGTAEVSIAGSNSQPKGTPNVNIMIANAGSGTGAIIHIGNTGSDVATQFETDPAFVPVITDGAELTPVATDFGELTPVATDFGELTPVATDFDELTPVATDFGELTPVATDFDELTPVATDFGELTPVATDFGELTPVVTDFDELTPVAADVAELTPAVTDYDQYTPIATDGELTPIVIGTDEFTPVSVDTAGFDTIESVDDTYLLPPSDSYLPPIGETGSTLDVSINNEVLPDPELDQTGEIAETVFTDSAAGFETDRIVTTERTKTINIRFNASGSGHIKKTNGVQAIGSIAFDSSLLHDSYAAPAENANNVIVVEELDSGHDDQQVTDAVTFEDATDADTVLTSLDSSGDFEIGTSGVVSGTTGDVNVKPTVTATGAFADSHSSYIKTNTDAMRQLVNLAINAYGTGHPLYIRLRTRHRVSQPDAPANAATVTVSKAPSVSSDVIPDIFSDGSKFVVEKAPLLYKYSDVIESPHEIQPTMPLNGNGIGPESTDTIAKQLTRGLSKISGSIVGGRRRFRLNNRSEFSKSISNNPASVDSTLISTQNVHNKMHQINHILNTNSTVFRQPPTVSHKRQKVGNRVQTNPTKITLPRANDEVSFLERLAQFAEAHRLSLLGTSGNTRSLTTGGQDRIGLGRSFSMAGDVVSTQPSSLDLKENSGITPAKLRYRYRDTIDPPS